MSIFNQPPVDNHFDHVADLVEYIHKTKEGYARLDFYSHSGNTTRINVVWNTRNVLLYNPETWDREETNRMSGEFGASLMTSLAYGVL